MRRLQLTQLAKSAAAFGLASAATVDAWLGLAHVAGYYEVPARWYLTAPLAAWALAGTPLTFHLAERLLETAYNKPGPITAFETSLPGQLDGGRRAIPYLKNGRQGTLLAHAVKSILGGEEPPPAPPRRTMAAWRVPVGDGSAVTIGERELLAFLELAARRRKYQFSRRYWTERRKPPMPRPRYEALMQLLTSAGLVEARTAGASGWLVGNLKPHNAVSYLKYESAYRV